MYKIFHSTQEDCIQSLINTRSHNLLQYSVVQNSTNPSSLSFDTGHKHSHVNQVYNTHSLHSIVANFRFPTGSKERGSAWSQTANNPKTHPRFTVTQSQRAVRDRFGILEKKATKRKREIEIKTELASPLKIQRLMWPLKRSEKNGKRLNKSRFQLDNQSKAKKIEKDKETAEAKRCGKCQWKLLLLLRRRNPIQMSQRKKSGVKSGEVAATQSSF